MTKIPPDIKPTMINAPSDAEPQLKEQLELLVNLARGTGQYLSSTGVINQMLIVLMGHHLSPKQERLPSSVLIAGDPAELLYAVMNSLFTDVPPEHVRDAVLMPLVACCNEKIAERKKQQAASKLDSLAAGKFGPS